MKPLTSKDFRLFQIAFKTATNATFHRCKTGCIVVHGNTVLSTGFNTEKTHSMQSYYNGFNNEIEDCLEHKLHAEIHALNQLKYRDLDWNRIKLYIYRIRNINGEQTIGLARPCPSCMEFIKKLGIKDIYYTTNDGYCYERLT